jgi:hypothetical protein
VSSTPILTLVFVGVVLIVLGIIAAGGAFEWVALGVAAIFGAGVLGVIADRGRREG